MQLKRHDCELCGDELKKGQQVLVIKEYDNDEKYFCCDCYNSYTAYVDYEGNEIGDENNSEEADYSPFKCSKCGSMETDEIYNIENNLYCHYHALIKLGFKSDRHNNWCKEEKQYTLSEIFKILEPYEVDMEGGL